MIDRVPPQNIEAEQAVLGAMLISKEAIAESAQILNPQDFYREAHRIVFEAMLDLSNRNQAVDNLTVIEQLNKTNQLEKSWRYCFCYCTCQYCAHSCKCSFLC